MSKQAFVDNIYTLAQKEGIELSKKATEEVVDAIFANVKTALKKSGKFSFPGFGSFSVRKRAARTGRNPRTGETIKIKASKTVGFKAAKTFKESL